MSRKAPKVESVIDTIVSSINLPQGIPELHVFVALKGFFAPQTIKKALAIGISENLFRRENGVLFPGSKFAIVKNKEEVKA